MSLISVAELQVEVTKKKVKYIHLKVCPPYGEVKVSAPKHMSLDSVRAFVISKISWVRENQLKIRNRKRELPPEYVSNEIHFFDGKKYILNVKEYNGRSRIILKEDTIDMYIKRGTNKEKRRSLLENYYRKHLKEHIPYYIDKWEPVMNVRVNYFNVKRMKTRWGTCNTVKGGIWLSLELAKREKRLLEYVIVHEMVHLLERNHTPRFHRFIDQFLPHWRTLKEELRELPI